MSAEAPPQLRITVTDTSTVFTGAANLHRFDAPSEHEIAVFVRNVFGPHPEGAHVHVSASRSRLERIEAALGEYDIALTTAELPEVPDDDPKVPADEEEGVEEWEEPQRSTVVVAAAVAVVVALVASATVILARWFMAAAEPEGPMEIEEPEETATEVVEKGDEGGVDKQLPPEPETVFLEEAGVRVELPHGFTAGDVGGNWRATGLDPDFRLHIAVEELYNLPAQAMADQVLAEIDADDETELVRADGQVLTYREMPGDGSEVLWKTWPEGNHQIFIACHTRTAPTKVQSATCRMAMESAEFSPEPKIS
ncbi:type VII secretion-associated protein [Corynebacterium sp. Q4381]|uniref:type VII secretion-associated protein n=1 Tax=Corynebacterium sp. Marseille-Q4381 TaxID=3121597 RepID=UPI002FE5DFB4